MSKKKTTVLGKLFFNLLTGNASDMVSFLFFIFMSITKAVTTCLHRMGFSVCLNMIEQTQDADFFFPVNLNI